MLGNITEWIISTFFVGILAVGVFFTSAIGLVTYESVRDTNTVDVSEESLRETSAEEKIEIEEGVDSLPPQLPPETISKPGAEKPALTLAKLPFNTLNTLARNATVNILCTLTTKRTVEATSGSGVIIDRRGVVLTNAHVAQLFLLTKDHPRGAVDCSIRTGDPAIERYEGTLLYLPVSWIVRHAKDIDDPEPRGTGEDDYAFLLITKTVDENLFLPTAFPFLTPEIDHEYIEKETLALLSGYPSETTMVESSSELETFNIVTTLATIGDLFTFDKDTLDLFSLAGNTLSYRGSSGGAVVSESGKLIGIITSSTEGATATERDLRAISLAHIDRSLNTHTGFGFDFLLLGDINIKAELFNRDIAPALTDQLVREFEN